MVTPSKQFFSIHNHPMEEVYMSLASELFQKIQNIPVPNRLLVAISGIPGSGKTTLADEICRRANLMWHLQHEDDLPIAIMIPMDGYHLRKAELDLFKDPTEAHARRGAHWTFNPSALLSLVERLRMPPLVATVITAPSFDHSIGDPIENDIVIQPNHRLLILEGLYLNLSEPEPWPNVANLMHERWFIEVDRQLARERVIKRHLATGLAKTPEAAAKRVDENDLINADFILAHQLPNSRVIRSIEILV